MSISFLPGGILFIRPGDYYLEQAGKGFLRKDGMWQREYTNGTVFYNPVGNRRRAITFNEERRRVSDGTAGNSFTINHMDGEVFLYMMK